MGYVDVGEEDYWEAEGGGSDQQEAVNVDVKDNGKKRKKADEDIKGCFYTSRCGLPHYSSPIFGFTKHLENDDSLSCMYKSD
jgi:hypothetical protein